MHQERSAEIIEIVLGVAPLIVSAFADYHATVTFLKAIKHYPKGLKEALPFQELCFRKANESRH